MIRIFTLMLCVFVVAQLSELQCPTGFPTGSAPNTPFTPAPRNLDAFADVSNSNAQVDEEVALEAGSDEGGNLAFSWAQTAGPGVVIENADRPTAFFFAPSLPDDTRFEFMVTIRNEQGDRGRARVEVFVAADPNFEFNANQNRRPNSNINSGSGGAARGPVANAGPDIGATEDTLVTLTGSQSTGVNLQYRWTQVDGEEVTLNSPDSVRATFTAPAFDPDGGNTLQFELRVTDERQRTDTDRVVVRVRSVAQVNPQVRIVTSMGNIVVELFPEDAPITVDNFLDYVDDDFYGGTIFHRVIPGFVVQGGGFLPGLTPRETRDPIVLEAGLPNERGTIAMARQNAPDSATAQFYFNLVDNPDLDPNGSPGYAVFGRILSGLEVVDRIATVPTESRDGFDDVPVTDVLINRVERVR